jgi:ribosomal RNA-processing protein 12
MGQNVSRLEKATHAMSAVPGLKPSSNDAALLPLWLDVVRTGFTESSRLQGMLMAAGHGA